MKSKEVLQRIIDTLNNEVKKEGLKPCDLLDGGLISYMNGNDGTDFDWAMNYRTCEFEIFYASTSLGFAKLSVEKNGKIRGYKWLDNGKSPAIEIEAEPITPGEALNFKRWIEGKTDKKDLYDETLLYLGLEESNGLYKIEAYEDETKRNLRGRTYADREGLCEALEFYCNEENDCFVMVNDGELLSPDSFWMLCDLYDGNTEEVLHVWNID